MQYGLNTKNLSHLSMFQDKWSTIKPMYKAPLPFTERLRLVWLACLDKRTPLPAKALIILGILYGTSPLDLIPDFIPVLGGMDDLAIIITVIVIFLRLTTRIRENLRRESAYETKATDTRPY